jgi:hypothetical protein
MSGLRKTDNSYECPQHFVIPAKAGTHGNVEREELSIKIKSLQLEAFLILQLVVGPGLRRDDGAKGSSPRVSRCDNHPSTFTPVPTGQDRPTPPMLQ